MGAVLARVSREVPGMLAVWTSNLGDVAAIAIAVVAMMTPIFAGTLFVLRAIIQAAMDKTMAPVLERLDNHDTRIARLEGIEEGKRFMFDQKKDGGGGVA